MKTALKTMVCMGLILSAIHIAHAQFTTPFLMQEGISAAKKAAADSGWKSPKMVAVITLGDTTGLGQTATLIGGVYNVKTGKSPVWIYVMNALDKNDSAFTKLLAYIKVPLLGLQQIPIPVDAGPGPDDIPLIPQDTLPSTILNSDAIASKLTSDPGYKSYVTKFPTAKPPVIIVTTLPFTLPGGDFPAGTPLWLFNFVDVQQQPVFDCYVHALNGTVVCQAPLGITEQIIEEHQCTVFPNPVPNGYGAQLSIPVALFDPKAKISVVNIMGETVLTINVNMNIGEKLQLPQFLSGSYFIRYNTESQVLSIPFIQY